MTQETLKIKQKCNKCNENYCIEMPKALCGDCFLDHAFKVFAKYNKPPKRTWQGIKHCTYFLMLFVLPLVFIGRYFNLEIELVCMGFFIWASSCMPLLIRFLMMVF